MSTVHSTTLALDTCHLYYTLIYTPSHQLRSASLNLLSQSRINITLVSRGFRYWPFPLKFPPSSSQINRLRHCLQIQSKNSPFLWCNHLWPSAISIHEFRIQNNHVDFCVLKLYYVTLCYVTFKLAFDFVHCPGVTHIVHRARRRRQASVVT